MRAGSAGRMLGAALIVGAFWGWIGILRANSFAAITVRLQKERGQTVISTGPYAGYGIRCTPMPCSS